MSTPTISHPTISHRGTGVDTVTAPNGRIHADADPAFRIRSVSAPGRPAA